MRTGIVSAVVLLLLVVVTVQYFERGENPRSSFATFAEMEAAGLIARGWLPEFLPRSATQIEETHSLDANTVSATFRYDVRDTQSVEAACEKASEDDRGVEFVCHTQHGQIATLLLGRDGSAYYSSSPHGV